MSSDTPSRRRQTAIAVINSYNKWKIEGIMALRTPDCVHEIVPKSLGRPVLNSAEEYAKWFGQFMTLFRNFHVEINEIIEDERENKVAVWCHSTADTDVGPYVNEYILILHMNEEGDKLVKFVEFADSHYSHTFFPKLREHVAQKATAGEKKI